MRWRRAGSTPTRQATDALLRGLTTACWLSQLSWGWEEGQGVQHPQFRVTPSGASRASGSMPLTSPSCLPPAWRPWQGTLPDAGGHELSLPCLWLMDAHGLRCQRPFGSRSCGEAPGKGS